MDTAGKGGHIIHTQDTCWLYDHVINHPHPLYSPQTKGLLGRRFMYGLRNELKKCREQKMNSETPLIFAACILRKISGVNKACAIKHRIK